MEKTILDTPYASAVQNKMDRYIEADEDYFSWGKYTLAVDSPNKSDIKRAAEASSIVTPLRKSILNADSEVLIISPYFVPRKAGIEAFTGLRERGVEVTVITNSLASTNHTMVNSGYAPWRRRLLNAGVELYEYRGDIPDTTGIVAPGTSATQVTLHTKAFVIDNETVYIGSLNMDPRSMHINTEMGLLIKDAGLAREVMHQLEEDMQPENAWRVYLTEDGELRWESSLGTVSSQHPPGHSRP